MEKITKVLDKAINDMEKLRMNAVMLTCPFCGSEPTLKKQGWYPKSGGVRQQTYQVRCGGCDMTDKFWSKDTPEEAVALWNKRH